MKTLRLEASPTPYRRLNEIGGLLVLLSGTLLLMSLASYTASDPSFDTAGGFAGQLHPAHNWVGLLGAWFADALLQTLGVASFLLPLLMLRIGISWVRSRPVGAPLARWTGLVLWVLFAPAAIALIPTHILFRHALPPAGLGGRFVADVLIHLLNLPGTIIVVGLMVVLSLYLATTFAFNSAREWLTDNFAFLRSVRERLSLYMARSAGGEVPVEMIDENGEVYGARREKVDLLAREEARRRAERAELEAERARRREQSMLGRLGAWFSRFGQSDGSLHIVPETSDEDAPPRSIWQAMPRTDVDAEPVTPFSKAAAAAAPYAAELAAAAAPLPLQPDELEWANGTHRAEEWIPEPAAQASPTSQSTPAQASFVEDIDSEEPFTFLSKRPASPVPAPALREPARTPIPAAPLPEPASAGTISFGQRADANHHAVAITAKSIRGYKLPSSSLLFHSDEVAEVREDALRAEAQTLVEKCAEFGVDGQVTQINPGPVVTTFEFRPDAGVKVARITGLADDLCLAMAAESILIERMAGKNTVGIQVPNTDRETIWLRDVVECESFAQSKSKLAIALGKDINGRIVTADLASMPHVLIAGSTGSGKSVAINAMIMSVLFKSTPEQVRMILVDPKRVELGMYEGIPHLFTPIITEAKLAANALRNAVREMERRLKLLAANHVRNIDQFNKLFDSGSEYLFDDVNQEPLPYIIIIIDELADLMMLDRSNVEESITRLAQMARAVGIHLILATQRPSVDVITGLIKANVPTRMSFRLATKVDSRTIIDSNGAESLLGRGDMLYLPPGTSRLQRVHAPFVTEKEIAAVTGFWRAQGEAEYVEGFLEGPKDEKGDAADGHSNDAEDSDPMFDDAVRLVFEFGKASTSLLQRRLRIGYGRAAHLVDMMERDGLVGPADGSKPREILKSADFYKEVDTAMR
jgi:S-DNA-T family DNA segregation ATPase FtsK/SpoIIIE